MRSLILPLLNKGCSFKYDQLRGSAIYLIYMNQKFKKWLFFSVKNSYKIIVFISITDFQ